MAETVDRRVRLARGLAWASALGAIAVGLAGIGLAPVCFLLMRPLMIDGALLLGGFAAYIGVACLALVCSGLWTWQTLLEDPVGVPRELGRCAAWAFVAGLPAIAWQIALAQFTLEGNSYWGHEWVAALGTGLISLPWPVFVCANVARWHFRRAVAAMPAPTPGPRARRVYRIVRGTAMAAIGASLVFALAWPTPPRLHGLGPPLKGATVGDWIERWRAGDPAGLGALVEAGAPAVPFVLAAGDGERGPRWVIADWLGTVFDLADNVAPLLAPVQVVRHLEDERFQVILHLRAGAATAVPEILARLEGMPRGHRVPACDALRAIGPDAVAAAPALRKIIADADGWERDHAAMALAAVSIEAADEVLPLFLDGLRTSRGQDLYRALQGLQSLGPRAAAAVPGLLPLLLARGDSTLDHFAVAALVAIEPDSDRVAAALIAALPTSGNIWGIIRALGELPTRAQQIVPVLGATLADPRADARRAAATALGKLGPEARAATPALVTACGDTDWHTRQAAALALGDIGDANPAVLAALETLLADRPTTGHAAYALARLGRADERIVEILTGEVGQRRSTVPAVRGLQACGPVAASALPLLRKLEWAAVWYGDVKGAIAAIEGSAPQPADK